jgi:hypothetical protein
VSNISSIIIAVRGKFGGKIHITNRSNFYFLIRYFIFTFQDSLRRHGARQYNLFGQIVRAGVILISGGSNMIGKLPMVSRLKDGRLFTILRDPNGNPLPRVLENDCWIEAEGVGQDVLADSKPLSGKEVWELVSKGILTR